MNLLELYDFAEQQNIDVDWFPLASVCSLSMPLSDGTCGIAIDPWKMDTLELETVLLGHELGHCMTGAFYNRWAARDLRQKHENRANRWAYKKLVPRDELAQAIANGYTEPWELAEHFGVTEPFLLGAVEYYKMLEFA